MNDHPNPESPPASVEAKSIDPQRGRAILKRMAGAVAVGAGGLLVLASLVTPGRCAGATRSSKLKWLARQEEVRRSLEALDNGQGSAANSKLEPTASKPSDP